MASNFNDSTPAAPSGGTNVKWQKDGSGNISAYVGATPSTPIDLTAQGADIAPTTILTPSVSGVFRLSIYIIVTRVATTSSVLPAVTITWTDPDNSTPQSVVVTPTSAGNLLTTLQQVTFVVDADLSTAITYETNGFASVGGTSMQYALHIRAEAL